ncbi:MAG: SH3 domain-containing protein [Defluviitaleaceae bacterium]|nr:SH3 domain-containing protein [Defluviitaleaceae bacterium]
MFKMILLVLSLFIFVPDLSVNASAEERRTTGVTLRQSHLYDGRGLDATRIKTISRNTNVRINRRHGDHYRVVVEGIVGWVPRNRIARTQQIAVAHRTAYLYHEPGGGSTRVRNASNQAVRITDGRRINVFYSTANWVQTRVYGHDGWVRLSHVEMETARRAFRVIDRVNVRRSPYAGSEVRHTLGYGTIVQVLQHTTTGMSQISLITDQGNVTGWVPRNLLAYHDDVEMRTSRSVALRRRADETSRLYGHLPANARVTVHNRIQRHGLNFYHVTATIDGVNRTGWIRSNRVRNFPTPNTTRRNPNGSPLTRLHTTSQSGRATRRTDFRRGRGEHYGLIRTLNNHANMSIRRFNFGHVWTQVRVDGVVGYVRTADIRLVTQGFALNDTQLRSRAGNGQPFIRNAELFAGQTMQLHAYSGNWYRVVAGGFTGYLHRRDVTRREYRGNSGAPRRLDLPMR